MSGALAGLAVVEWGTGAAIALAARTMAGYGADVIKVEPPEGDPARTAGPFCGDNPSIETSAAHLFLHGGKRSVVLDPVADEDLALLVDLVRRADVLLTDVPLARRESWGLEWETLRASAPQLSIVSVSPYGEHGPHSDHAASGLTTAAAGGQMSMMGDIDAEPLKAYGDQAQLQSSFSVLGSALAAVFRRVRTGVGAYVEISIQEVQASAMEQVGPIVWNGDPDPHRLALRVGNHLRSIWSYYPCKDGYVGVFINASNYRAFFQTIGHPELMDQVQDNAFVAGPLLTIIEEWCAARTRQEVFDAGVAGGAPLSYVATPEGVLASDIVARTGLWTDVDHPSAGRFRVPGAPFRASRASFDLRRAPLLGEHTTTVLAPIESGRTSAPSVT
jgi:crotonobetainyl-CoA:carnitine CoA-transferase CaiB-like acyl-CoA transferase